MTRHSGSKFWTQRSVCAQPEQIDLTPPNTLSYTTISGANFLSLISGPFPGVEAPWVWWVLPATRFRQVRLSRRGKCSTLPRLALSSF